MFKSGIACLALLTTASTACAAPACPPSTVFSQHLDHLDGYRVFTGPDGDSQVAKLRIDGKIVPMLKTGKQLGLIPLLTAPKRPVELVMGAPDVELALHPTPYKEMFVMISGSVTLKTRNFSAELGPGSVLLFEDMDAKAGHGGHTGPCGYVSISIAP
jgi:mannose-6-phosphate isomerase-like protein (cupin superfamily)